VVVRAILKDWSVRRDTLPIEAPGPEH
jgi:hypothetical protein